MSVLEMFDMLDQNKGYREAKQGKVTLMDEKRRRFSFERAQASKE